MPIAAGGLDPQVEPEAALGPTPIDAYSNLYLGIDILLHSKKQNYKQGQQKMPSYNPRATTSILTGSQPYKDEEMEINMSG